MFGATDDATTPPRAPSSPHADPSNLRRRTKRRRRRRRRRRTIIRRRGSRKPSTETAIKPRTRGALPDLLIAVLARQTYIPVGALRCGAVRRSLVHPARPDLPPRDVVVLGRNLDRTRHPHTLAAETGASHARPRAHEDLAPSLPVGGTAWAALLALLRP